MRCGYCKAPDVTIEHVKGKLCDTTGAASTKFVDSGLKQVTEPPRWPASDKQIDYVLGLQDERLLPEHWGVWTRDQLVLLERDEVSAQISLLKSFTKKDGGSKPSWTMREGRYAVHHGEKDGWRFYQVDKPKEGRWAGYTFIKRLIGRPGSDYQKVDMRPAERNAVLGVIEQDPLKAMIDYGKQSSHCGNCGSALSNDDKPGPDGLTSVQRGIGPVCAGKMGMYS